MEHVEEPAGGLVNGHHHRAAAAAGELAEGGDDSLCGGGVQTRGGLVEEDEARIYQHLLPYAHPLPLPAGDSSQERPSDDAAPAGGETQLDDDGIGGGGLLRARERAGETKEGCVEEGLRDGEVRVEDIVLGDKAEVAAHGGGEGTAIVGDGPREGGAAETAAEGCEEGGLAAARGAEHGEHLPRADQTRHTVEDRPLRWRLSRFLALDLVHHLLELFGDPKSRTKRTIKREAQSEEDERGDLLL